MSDELMIQPQIQPQRVSAMPYVLGGAAAGAAAGWGATALYDRSKSKGAMSHDELVAEANKNDSVELKSKQDAVEKAEKELAEASKAVYEGEERKLLDDAIAKRDAKLEELTKPKEITIKKGAEILPFNPEWPLGDTRRAIYQQLYTDYEAAKNTLESSSAYIEARDAVNNRRAAIDGVYNDILADIESTVKPKSTDKKDIKSLEQYLSDSKGKATIEKAIIDHDLIKLTDAELIQLGGGDKKLLDAPGAKKGGYEYFEVTLKNGTKKYAKVQTTNKVGKGKLKVDFGTEYQKLLQKKANEASDNIANTLKVYIDTKNKQDKLAETIKIDKGLLRNLGVKRPDVDVAFLEDLKANIKTFESDLKVIDGAKLVKTGGTWGYDPAVQRVIDSCNVDTREEAKKILDSKLGIGRIYEREANALQETIDNIVEKDKALSKLQNNFNKVKRSSSVLNRLESQIRGQFEDYLGKATTTTTTTSLSVEKAKNDKGYQDLAKVVEDRQAAYNKVVAEKGKVNEGAKKAAEENLSKVKGELEEFLGKFGKEGKKLGGGVKAAIIGGTALVAGLIGSSMASSKNKKIEAEAQNLYA